MKRLLVLVIGLGMLAMTSAQAKDKKKQSPRDALQVFNEFIGTWKGNGGPDRPSLPKSGEGWTETIDWGWRFKDQDAWLTITFKNSKLFKSGELRYLPDKKAFELTAIDAQGKKRVFKGEYENEYATFERVDPESKETQQLKMNLAAGGVRLIYRYAHKPEGRTIYKRDYMVAATKEGEALAAKAASNKIECVVSGGLGTMPVSFGGKTYYVCCSGCLEEFRANPEKYVKEFEAKKKKKR
jgi:hypothetical protein